jgi:hypothetical protein
MSGICIDKMGTYSFDDQLNNVPDSKPKGSQTWDGFRTCYDFSVKALSRETLSSLSVLSPWLRVYYTASV